MIKYIERKIKQLKANYNKEDFVRLYAYAIREKEKMPKEDTIKMAGLFAEFVEVKKKELPKEKKQAKTIIHYKDTNDKNQLQWGGKRASSRLFDHPMRSAPMFFRRNGMVADLINLYQGSSVFLINNGPSFANVDKEKLKLPGIVTFGMNNGAQQFRPNIWSCVDDPTRFMSSIWEDPTILKIIPQAHQEKPYWKNNKKTDKLVGDCPNIVGYRRNETFYAKHWLYEDTINWGNHKNFGGGRSIMLSVLKICYLLGFKNVYLLGCDFNMSDTEKYWFDEQRTKAAINNNNNSYKKMIGYFTELKPLFKEVNFNVYNLNPKSNLKVFEFKDFDECIQQERINNNESTYGMYVKREK